MSSIRSWRTPFRASRFEPLEARLVLTAQPWSEFELIAPNSADVDAPIAVVSSESPTDIVAQIRDEYGFNGSGQTVAIIDTGIAWDHAALGAGFGAGHRIVGGWDFAENDANPYDDGPFGYHGTHVAGIVASDDARYPGVASGVELVALRVFDDYGTSNFSWVENALRWVHEHRFDFDNPITTVNLSLGTKVNLADLPALASLEDEFNQLRLDGIFVSVAAGNAFKTFQSIGLSYPAVSPNVVPVASHDSDGQLSDFSQRHDRVLVAPGRDIASTVPNHLFANGQTNGFLSGSGTSMAAPFVSGASTLVREAMQFMGQSSIDQYAIYQQFLKTADHVFDSITQRSYSRMDLEAALNDVMRDDHADVPPLATSLNHLTDSLQFRGTIGGKSDLDQFVFTASASGTATLKLDVTHGMRHAIWVNGTRLDFGSNELSFDVAAGSCYELTIGTDSSIGHYTGTLQLSLSWDPIEWGRVFQREFNHLSIDTEQWFSLTAGRSGFLTIENIRSEGVRALELYDAGRQRIASAAFVDGQWRLDQAVEAGQNFFVRIAGDAGNVDIRVTNQVTLDQGRLTLHGTAGAENVFLQIGDRVTLRVDGVDYSFDSMEVSHVIVKGGAGHDQLQIIGSAADDRVRLDVGSFWWKNSTFYIEGTGFEVVAANGGGGFDVGILADSAGDDIASDLNGRSGLHGTGYDHFLQNFDRARLVSRSGTDWAYLSNSSSDDRLESTPQKTIFHSANRTIIVDRFAGVEFQSDWVGTDMAVLHPDAAPESPNNRIITVQTNAHPLVDAWSVVATNAIRSPVHSPDWNGTYDDHDYLGRSISQLQVHQNGIVGSIQSESIAAIATVLSAIDSVDQSRDMLFASVENVEENAEPLIGELRSIPDELRAVDRVYRGLN